MKSHTAVVLSALIVVAIMANGRSTIADSSDLMNSEVRSLADRGQEQAPRIVGFQRQGNTGFVFTQDALFRTDDNGRTWTELALPKNETQIIVQARFSNTNGWVLTADHAASSLILIETGDAGQTWTSRFIATDAAQWQDADLDRSSLDISSSGREWRLTIPVETSSNFRGWLTYLSLDRGNSWQFRSRTVDLNTAGPDSSPDINSDGWTLHTDGECLGVKSGCVQITRLLAGTREITPPQVAELTRAARLAAANEAVPMFASPGGSTRVSTNKGFDKCTAFSTTDAQIWWDNSPYYNVNIYMSGRNRACKTQPFNGNPAWLTQVNAMGWGLIPTVVGYQSPCTASTTTVKLSYDPTTAESQGRGEADIAVNDANAIGITTGSILYYDMERYDPPNPDTLGCEPATRAFLKGWTDRIHELGFMSGVYGSPFNAQNHWVNLPAASKMDVVWLANWDNRPTVWFYNSFQSFPTSLWPDHQRVKQYSTGTESWGGSPSFGIDRDISDAPVAAPVIARNKNADFDGDGRSDASIFRPSEGVWYVLSSVNFTYSGTGFGLGTDVLAPGDFDSDGKTDYCVFRPSSGTWYMLTKAGTFSARQFGSDGDIPVPADYNGDGKTDIAVFRPSDGVWYIANSDSQGSYTFIQFGQAGDKPVPGDYDGDGKSEIAVYRPSNGTWYILRIADLSYYGVTFGISTDQLAQGDFDGDGRTDEAVFRDGTWYMMRSSSGFSAMSFGQVGDVPVTGDYDGDGKADVAVFRPSTGIWYVMRSQAGFWAASFGQNGDRPIEAAYLPQ